MYPSSKMQDEGIFFMRTKRFRYDFLSGSIVWRKHVPEKRKKIKTRYAVSRYVVTPLRDLLTTLLNHLDVLEDIWTVKRAFTLLRLT